MTHDSHHVVRHCKVFSSLGKSGVRGGCCVFERVRWLSSLNRLYSCVHGSHRAQWPLSTPTSPVAEPTHATESQMSAPHLVYTEISERIGEGGNVTEPVFSSISLISRADASLSMHYRIVWCAEVREHGRLLICCDESNGRYTPHSPSQNPPLASRRVVFLDFEGFGYPLGMLGENRLHRVVGFALTMLHVRIVVFVLPSAHSPATSSWSRVRPISTPGPMVRRIRPSPSSALGENHRDTERDDGGQDHRIYSPAQR